MKLIVGLGNPGIEYQFTPHNLGFLTIDRLAGDLNVEVRNRQCQALTARAQIGSEQVLLAKPETFMNLSGTAVQCLLEQHELRPEADLIVIYDELDLPMGTIRIRERGSSEPLQSQARATGNHVGTAALGRPVERSSTIAQRNRWAGENWRVE